LTGVLCTITGGEFLLAVTISGVFVLTAFSYLRGHEDDPARITWIAKVKSILASHRRAQEALAIVTAGCK
jgi:hypothetical protein